MNYMGSCVSIRPESGIQGTVLMSNGDDITAYFATNRYIVESDDEPHFGNRFNEKGPQIFQVGEAIVERVSRRRSEYRFRRARLEPEDLSSPNAEKVKLGSRSLFDTMRQQLADTRRDALVYLHGFANTFENTMERAAALHDHYLIAKKATDGSSGEPYSPFVFAFSWLWMERFSRRSSTTRAIGMMPRLRVWR
jgi:esterase/lipase superfamily enzyme